MLLVPKVTALLSVSAVQYSVCYILQHLSLQSQYLYSPNRCSLHVQDRHHHIIWYRIKIRLYHIRFTARRMFSLLRAKSYCGVYHGQHCSFQKCHVYWPGLFSSVTLCQIFSVPNVYEDGIWLSLVFLLIECWVESCSSCLWLLVKPYAYWLARNVFLCIWKDVFLFQHSAWRKNQQFEDHKINV